MLIGVLQALFQVSVKMSSASSLQDAVAQKLQYYMTIKRREEDFDSTTRSRPSSSRVLLLANPQPMISYSQMKDRSLKHYFTSPMIRSQIAKLEAMPPGTERERDVKSTVVRKMKKKRTSFEDLSLADPEIRAEAYKAQLQALKILRRNASSRFHRQMDHGGKLSRKMLSPNLSKGEANRIVDHASQILVATETVAIAQEILDDRHSPRRKHRPQSAPPVHLPRSQYEPSYGHNMHAKRKRRPKYCWDINGRRVSYRKSGNTQRPGSATSEYSTTTFDDSDSDMLHARHPTRPMSAKERPYPQQQSTRQILRNRPYSADALYLSSYGNAMPSDSRRGFAFGNHVYAMDMATQTVQDIGMQTDLSMIKPQPPSDIRKYYIKVTTGSRAAAGTKADVYVVLQGKERRSDEIFLTETVTGSRPFKKGQVDIFMIETENVGQLVRLGIGHDQEEKDFSWYVMSVEVKSGSQSWQFPCNQWLQNKSTFVFLKPETAASDSAPRRHSTRSRSNSSLTDTSLSSGSFFSSGKKEPPTRQRQVKQQESSRSSSRSSDREQSRKAERSRRRRKTSSRSSSSHQSSRRKSDSSHSSSKKKLSSVNADVPMKTTSALQVAAKSTKPKVQDGSDIEYSSDHSKDDPERIVESIVEESIDSDSSDSSTITNGSDKEADDVIQVINAMNKPTESNSSFSEPDPTRQRRRGSLFENLKEQSTSESEKEREEIIVKTRKSSSSSSSSSDDSQNSSFDQNPSHASLIPEDTIQSASIRNDSNGLSNELTFVKDADENMQKSEKSIDDQIKDDGSSSSSSSEDKREQKLKLLTTVSIEDSSSDSSSESEIEEAVKTDVVVEKEQSIEPHQEDISLLSATAANKATEDVTVTPTMYPTETHDSSSSSSSSSSDDEREVKVESTSLEEKVLEAPVAEEFPTSLSMAFPIRQPDVETTNIVGEELQIASPQRPETVHQPVEVDQESTSLSISEEEDLLLSSSSSSEEEDLKPLMKIETRAEEHSDVKDETRAEKVETLIFDSTAFNQQLIKQEAKSPASESDSETLISSGESGEELSSTSSDEDESTKAQPPPTLERESEKFAPQQLEPIAPMPILSHSPRPQENKASLGSSPAIATAVPLSVTADVHEPTSESSSSSTSSSSEEEDYVLDENDIYHAIMNDDIDRVREILMRHPTVINEAVDNEQTVLQYAASHGKTRMVKVLLENRADYNAENKAGYTAIHLAAKNGHLQIVQIMVSFGVNLESQNIEGHSPLHVAAISGELDVVKWLALNGANVKAKDMGGRSAIALAKQNRHEDVVTFLTNFMRKKNIPMESSSSESSLLSSTSSSSSESEKEQQQRAPRRSVVETLAEREQEEIEEKKRMYEQQQNNMKKRRISFLDEIRMENE